MVLKGQIIAFLLAIFALAFPLIICFRDVFVSSRQKRKRLVSKKGQ